MIPKLKRTLYIGLGGTGFKTLLHTKRAFIETYGEVPPMIKFLVFDSDQNQYKNYSLPSIYGDITFDPAESSDIMVKQAKEKVARSRNDLSWLPDKNINAVEDLVNGCGMVRTNGRIAFSFNYSKSKSSIKNALNQICNVTGLHNDKYSLIAQDVEVNLVFSIAGGTGSGNFIDMAYLVKDIFREQALPETSKIIGYMILPDVYDAQLQFGKDRLFPNSFGSLVDLDYLMHQPFNKETQVNYLTEQKNLAGAPFNTIIVIGNSNHNGDVVNHSDSLSEMLSLAMVVSAGELSSGMQSVANNLERDKNSGDFDIEQKRAILGTLGMSEITFHASELSKLFKIKAAREIAASLLSRGSNVDTDANAWIDTEQIRENNGQDHVIDFLLKKQPAHYLQDIYDKANPGADINNYRNQKNIKPDADQLIEKVKELESRVKEDFDYKLEELVNSYGPVYALEFLGQLRNQIDICLKEMRQEKEDNENTISAKESAINAAIEEYKDALKKIFGRNKAVSEAVENLCAQVVSAVVTDREIARRNGAISFYTWLLQEINQSEKRLTTIKENIKSVVDILDSEIATSTARLSASRGLFEIDLTKPYINEVTVNRDDVSINQFVLSLSDGLKINDFDRLKHKEIINLLMKYTSTLNSGGDWEQLSVEDALIKLPKNKREEIIKRAIALSSPMCPLNFRGFMNKNLNNYYYIGVAEQSETGLNGGIIDVKQCISGNEMYETYFSSIGTRDRIVFYHQYGVFPTFAIAGSDSYQHSHELYMNRPNAYSCFLDEDLRVKMEREKFSIIPTERVDNSMELWVKGLIFALIKRDENGNFMFKDEENDEAALDNYFTSLNTQYRDEAFKKFKRESHRLQEQYEKVMGNRIKSEGQDNINAMLADAKENYLSKYSLNNLSKEEINNSLYKSIKEQILAELKYVREEL